MNPSMARSVLNTTFTTAERLGATVPKVVIDEHRRLAVAAERSRQMYRELHADLAGAVVAALEAERDPASDPEVQQAATRRAILQVQDGVEQAIAARTHNLLSEQGAAILAAFDKPFTKAATTITHAVDRIGDVAIDDMHAVLARGGDAAKMWAEARTAVDTIAAIQQAWKLLSSTASHLHVDPRYWLLTIAEVPAGTFVDEQFGRPRISAWDAARRGFTLSLATPDTLRQRIQTIQSEVVRRQGEPAAAFASAARQRYGMSAA